MMSASPATGPQEPIRRSATLPLRLAGNEQRNSNAKKTSNAPPPEEDLVLFSHPAAKIVHFAPAAAQAQSQPNSKSADLDYPVDTIETLPWRSSTDRTVAVGMLRLEKTNLAAFLKCGSVVRAIMKNSQCWCVDRESTFVLRIRPLTYYRIELPFETEEDKTLVAQFKDALSRALRYEATPCPFQRGFSVEIPEEARVPRKKRAWQPKDRRESAPVGTFQNIDWNDVNKGEGNNKRPSSAGSPSLNLAEESAPIVSVPVQDAADASVPTSTKEQISSPIASHRRSSSRGTQAEGVQKFDTVLATFERIPESDDEEETIQPVAVDSLHSTLATEASSLPRTVLESSPSLPSKEPSEEPSGEASESASHSLDDNIDDKCADDFNDNLDNSFNEELDKNLNNKFKDSGRDDNLKVNFDNNLADNVQDNLNQNLKDSLIEKFDDIQGQEPGDHQGENEDQIRSKFPSGTISDTNSVRHQEIKNEHKNEHESENAADTTSYSQSSVTPRDLSEITDIPNAVFTSTQTVSSLENKTKPDSAATTTRSTSVLNARDTVATPIWRGPKLPDAVSTGTDISNIKFSNDRPSNQRLPLSSRSSEISPAPHASTVAFRSDGETQDLAAVDFRKLLVVILIPPLRFLFLVIRAIVKIALSSPSELMQSFSASQQQKQRQGRTTPEKTERDSEDDFGVPTTPKNPNVLYNTLDDESDSGSEL